MVQNDKPAWEMTSEELAQALFPPEAIEMMKLAANPPELPKPPKASRPSKKIVP